MCEQSIVLSEWFKSKKQTRQISVADSSLVQQTRICDANIQKKMADWNGIKAMKISGFNIEDTHVTELKRIEKLVALVIVAFSWAYVVSDYLNHYIKSI